jgi:hypothetical protein
MKSKAPPKPTTRRLLGNTHCHYRTIDPDASATVRGTELLAEDTCSDTLIHVAQGEVSVDDFRRRRSFLLAAPHSFMAHQDRGG